MSDRFSTRDGNQIRTLPGLDSGAPQIRITPDLSALARAGVSVREFSMAIDVFNDGANVIQVPIDGELIDMVVSGKDAENLTTNALKDIPIVTKIGNILRVEQLAKIEVISAPEQIRRLGGRQAISIRLRPTEALSLEDVVNVIDTKILPPILGDAIDRGVTIKLEGAASASQWRAAMQANVLTAIMIICFW